MAIDVFSIPTGEVNVLTIGDVSCLKCGHVEHDRPLCLMASQLIQELDGKLRRFFYYVPPSVFDCECPGARLGMWLNNNQATQLTYSIPEINKVLGRMHDVA